MNVEDEKFLEELEREFAKMGYVITEPSEEEISQFDPARIFDEDYSIPWERKDIQWKNGGVRVYRKILTLEDVLDDLLVFFAKEVKAIKGQKVQVIMDGARFKVPYTANKNDLKKSITVEFFKSWTQFQYSFNVVFETEAFTTWFEGIRRTNLPSFNWEKWYEYYHNISQIAIRPAVVIMADMIARTIIWWHSPRGEQNFKVLRSQQRSSRWAWAVALARTVTQSSKAAMEEAAKMVEISWYDIKKY